MALLTAPPDSTEVPLHAVARDAVLAALGSSERGLTSDEARNRLDRFGTNDLPEPRRPSLWLRFAAQFTDLFAVLLLAAAVITTLAYFVQNPHDVGNLQLTIAILCVVLINAAIGFAQEYSAERTAQALQAMVPHTCRVVRDGVRQEIDARLLVPGDVVLLEAGDAVPADCRLTEVHSFAVNNASLTGESAPVTRRADPVAAGVAELEARNLVFMGTTVAAGSGRAVVARTGARTQFGRIFGMTMEAPAQKSPLQRQVALMARRIAGVAVAIGTLVFAIRLPSDQPIVETFLFGLGVMVALVPEGLPATMSVSLAIGVRRMANYHAVVKRLLAVEALGSTTVICTDKTGTLTQAEMTVTQVWVGGAVHAVTGVGYAPEGTVENAATVAPLLRRAALCSNARVVAPDAQHGWRVLGDTTEGALIVAAAKVGIDLADAERETPRVGEFPFDSSRKLMTTVHELGDGRYEAYVKGSPQELLARCSTVEWDGRLRELDDPLRAEIGEANDAMARPGLRVLGVAYRRVDAADVEQADAESGLTLCGLVGMLDPPRPEVTAAVAACRHAGIRIVMVTGDHALTAEAVARRVGIVRGDAPRVISGTALSELSEPDLDAVLADPADLLFCRVSPEHKMRVVTALQRAGEVVAVTGDGANDAPALKHADIGVAMGRSGTDVAREASVMVLLDDSFAAIAAAVRLGRSVYQNIRKFLIYVFVSNVGELVPILAATFVGFPLVPLTAVQVLAVDLGTDVLPALALGAEPPERDVMDRPPRRRTEPLFSGAVMRRIVFLGLLESVGVCVLFFWRIHSSGLSFDDFTTSTPAYREAITLTHAAIVLGQFFVGFTVRSDRHSIFRVGVFSNPSLIAAAFFALGVIAAISYLPALQSLFHTAPLDLTDWGLLVLFGLLVIVADELRKFFLRRREIGVSA